MKINLKRIKEGESWGLKKLNVKENLKENNFSLPYNGFFFNYNNDINNNVKLNYKKMVIKEVLYVS